MRRRLRTKQGRHHCLAASDARINDFVASSEHGQRELTMMRWGMPPPLKFGEPPVTNIRNTASPHGRGRLKLENGCLV
jgi:putative SOS response-associated peptidase YedK